MTQAEKEKFNLLAEAVRLRRLCEMEHDETESYKKLYLDTKKDLDEAKVKLHNYRLFFKKMNVDLNTINEMEIDQ